MGQEATPTKVPRKKKAASAQMEMLMPIDKKTKETAAKKTSAKPQRKSA